MNEPRVRYIDVCRGEVRLRISKENHITISGPKMDEQKLIFIAQDGLRDRIAELNGRLHDCIDALEALATQHPEVRR